METSIAEIIGILIALFGWGVALMDMDKLKKEQEKRENKEGDESFRARLILWLCLMAVGIILVLVY